MSCALETKEHVWGKGGGGMHALTYYVARQGSRSPAHLIKLDYFVAFLGITLHLKSLEEIS